MITRNKAGFLIGELLIAMLAMTIITFVMMGYYVKTRIIHADAQLYLQATTMASSALEKILAQRKIPTVMQQKEGIFTIDVHTSRIADVDACLMVDATVRWQSPTKVSRSVTMRSAFILQAGDNHA